MGRKGRRKAGDVAFFMHTITCGFFTLKVQVPVMTAFARDIGRCDPKANCISAGTDASIYTGSSVNYSSCVLWISVQFSLGQRVWFVFTFDHQWLTSL